MLRRVEKKGMLAQGMLTTMWNLMSRVDNVVGIRKSHVEWRDDDLVIYFAQEKKTDHTRNKSEGILGICTRTPYQPEICPMLSQGL